MNIGDKLLNILAKRLGKKSHRPEFVKFSSINIELNLLNLVL